MIAAAQIQAAQTRERPSEAVVLSKAVTRAADFLEVPNAVLARVLGLSPASISRLKNGTFTLSPGTKPFELAQLFVRLFRSLDAITGSDDNASRSWLRARNLALNGQPIDLMQTVTGLTSVLGYVDSRRAPL
ncbi:MAG TPA: antitoxin Xre/MbcA/ParS toxin-binding domain-containing protein [Stellaceae bacterium]|nr:antitoxin Xre/MbcA/ParS toxin-binding domain-containing protein [Stellaceae bacterium]